MAGARRAVVGVFRGVSRRPDAHRHAAVEPCAGVTDPAVAAVVPPGPCTRLARRHCIVVVVERRRTAAGRGREERAFGRPRRSETVPLRQRGGATGRCARPRPIHALHQCTNVASLGGSVGATAPGRTRRRGTKHAASPKYFIMTDEHKSVIKFAE